MLPHCSSTDDQVKSVILLILFKVPFIKIATAKFIDSIELLSFMNDLADKEIRINWENLLFAKNAEDSFALQTCSLLAEDSTHIWFIAHSPRLPACKACPLRTHNTQLIVTGRYGAVIRPNVHRYILISTIHSSTTSWKRLNCCSLSW